MPLLTQAVKQLIVCAKSMYIISKGTLKNDDRWGKVKRSSMKVWQNMYTGISVKVVGTNGLTSELPNNVQICPTSAWNVVFLFKLDIIVTVLHCNNSIVMSPNLGTPYSSTTPVTVDDPHRSSRIVLEFKWTVSQNFQWISNICLGFTVREANKKKELPVEMLAETAFL